MTSTNIIHGIAIVVLSTTFCISWKHFLSYKKSIKKIEAKEYETMEMQTTQRAALECQRLGFLALQGFYKDIIKQAGIEVLEVNGEEIDIDEVRRVLFEDKDNTPTCKVITVEYKVTDIHIRANGTFIDVVDKIGNIIKGVTLPDGLFAKDNYEILKTGLDKQFFKMQLTMMYKGMQLEYAALSALE